MVGRAIRAAFTRRPVIVATFDPHPVRHFKPDVPPFRLTTLDQREACSPMPVPTRCSYSGSTARLASIDAEEFVADMLVSRIGAAGVMTGDDFTSARGARAMWPGWKKLGAQYGVGAEAVAQVLLDGDAHLVGPNPRRAGRG